MSAKQALADLIDRVDSARRCSLFFAGRTKKTVQDLPVVQRVQLGTEAESTLLARTKQDLHRKGAEVVLKKYVQGLKPDSHQLLFAKVAEIQRAEQLIELLRSPHAAEMFSADDKFLENLRFFAVNVSKNPGPPAILLRYCTPQVELRRGKAFTLLMSKGAYEELVDSALSLSIDFDCMVFGDYLFVSNVDRFHKIFDYYEDLVAAANKAIDIITAKVPILNVDEFKAAIASQPQMLAKVGSIAARPYLDKLEMKDVEEVIAKAKLAVPVTTADGKKQLVFEKDFEKRWTLLSIFDDDYVESIMTGTFYETNSKSPLA